MSTGPNRVFRLWALILSLTVHLVLLLSTGIRSSTIRNVESAWNVSTENLKITLIQHPSTTSTAKFTVNERKGTLQTSATYPSRLSKFGSNVHPVIFEVPTAPEHYYFKTSELAEKPHVLTDISPDLALSLAGELPQSAIVRLLINEQGEIDQVIIDESVFSEANQSLVREAFAKMKFEPGKISGKAVKVEMKIEIKLENVIPDL